MHRSFALRALLLPLLLTAAPLGCTGLTSHPIDPQRVAFPYQWEDEFALSSFTEPSGAVIHSERGTLFIVGDEGDIMELTLEGEVVKQTILREGADLEGITCDPTTGLLYVAVEGEEKILEVAPDALAVRRTFTIDRMYEGELRMHPDGDGIEGITFIPRPSHPEGGVFVVAHQSFVLDNPEEPSALMRVEAPLRSGRSKEDEAKIVGMALMPIIDMSALHYDAQRNVIYALSDADNVILTVNHDGEVIDTRAFPGNEQEGLAIDDDDFVYIAQDTGGMIKVKWRR